MSETHSPAGDPLDLLRRPRRNRRTMSIRELTAETTLSPKDFICPLFVKELSEDPSPVPSMPGIFRYSIEGAVRESEALLNAGVKAVAFFPATNDALKDESGKEALNAEGLIPRAIKAVKDYLPEMTVIADVALDPYTTHGHDGLLNAAGEVDNDPTVGVLAKMSLILAGAGADFIAPSDMMDGRVKVIRQTLDRAGLTQTGILAYSAKFASAYYGPFREAVGSVQAEGADPLDKRSYQMSPANRREALLEARLDEEEGADILMVKPAGLYLDIIREIRNQSHLPLAAYQVSGEYAQIQAAAAQGWLDLDRAMMESLLSIKRAGADLILTYFAKKAALSLKS